MEGAVMAEEDARIRVYLNKSRTDKIERDAPVEEWRAFHREWFPAELTARQLAIAVWKGYSFAPVFNGRKLKSNFREAWHIALDFDTEDEQSAIEYLNQRDYIQIFSSFLYTTPSHTPEAPRSRVIWILDEPITDYKEYEQLYLALLHRYSWADKSAKDAARFFFGSKGCTLHGNWSILPRPICDSLINEYESTLPDPDAQRAPLRIEHDEVNPRFLEVAADKLLDNVRQAQDGEKHWTLNRIAYVFGGYIQSGYYNESDVEAWLRAEVDRLQNVASKQSAYDTIQDGITAGKNAPLYFEVNQAARPGDKI